MAKRPTVTSITSGYASNTQLNANFEALRDGFDNTLSLDGSVPNAMEVDFDLGGNDLLNGGTIAASDITVGGTSIAAQVSAAAASAAAALVSETATAADLLLTDADTVATAADRVQTGLDAAATAADLVQTNLDQIATSADAVATAADRVQTGLDAAATAADVIQTNADVVSSAASAGAASTSETNAAASEAAAAASYDSFDDRYLGAKASDPVVDNDGDPLITGALYFSTASNEMRTWDGSAWVAAFVSLAGALIASNNLSDVDNAATALSNLGLSATATEINVLDGITASTAELNIMDGITASTAELNTLTGITATVTELNYVDGVTSNIQTQIDNIPAPPELTQVQVEDDTSTVFGQVSGERLGQAVAASDQGGSRKELARTTVAVAVASVTMTSFDHAKYRHYEFVFRDLVSSSTSGKDFDITLNGISTSGSYDNSYFGSLGSADDSTASSTANFQYSFTEDYNGDLKLFASGNASKPTVGFGTYLAAFTSGARMATGGFSRNGNEVATSITFAFSAGNITSGDIIMYGVK